MLPESEFIGILLPYWHATAKNKPKITIQYNKMLNNALGISESMKCCFLGDFLPSQGSHSEFFFSLRSHWGKIISQ